MTQFRDSDFQRLQKRIHFLEEENKAIMVSLMRIAGFVRCGSQDIAQGLEPLERAFRNRLEAMEGAGPKG